MISPSRFHNNLYQTLRGIFNTSRPELTRRFATSIHSAESVEGARADTSHSAVDQQQPEETEDWIHDPNGYDDDAYSHHPKFMPQSKRRALPSPTLPLEAVTISRPVQKVLESYVRAHKMRRRELRDSYQHFQTARARETYKVKVERQLGRPQVTPVPAPYKVEHVTAYCANRFPGTFAAHVNVLAEIRRILPSFSPASLLDFGSGAGTALLAMTRVLTSPSFYGRSELGLKNGDSGDEQTLAEEEEEEEEEEDDDDDIGDLRFEDNELQEMKLNHAWLIDYSAEMRTLSKNISQSDELIKQHVKDIMRTPSLSDGPPKSRKYDIVCASYSLSELVRMTLYKPHPREISRLENSEAITEDFMENGTSSTPAETCDAEHSGSKGGGKVGKSTINSNVREKAAELRLRKTVRSLWRRTAPGGVLVIIEDGTAAGFETVLYAREMLLARYGPYAPSNQPSKNKQTEPDVEKHETGLEQLSPTVEQSQNQDQLQDQDNENEEDTSKAFARVIAPCIHSRSCPLDGSVSRHRICRFVQRLNRPPLQRETFPMHNAFEDEYFSYIAIQKVARNSDQRLAKDPELLDAVHSDQWARLIRAPLRRRKHIVMDGCTQDAQLERRVISKGTAKPGFFSIARHTKWGDIWPEPPADNCSDVNF